MGQIARNPWEKGVQQQVCVPFKCLVNYKILTFVLIQYKLL